MFRSRMMKAAVMAMAIAVPAMANAGSSGEQQYGAEQRRQVAVSMDDLNLAHPAGREQLARRIDTAVHRVCGRADLRDLIAARAARHCRSLAMHDAELAMANRLDRAEYALARSDIASR